MLACGATLMCMADESSTRIFNDRSQCYGLVEYEIMLFVVRQQHARRNYSYCTMMIEAARSTKTFLKFYPNTWYICEGHTYDTYHWTRLKHFVLHVDNYSYPKHYRKQKLVILTQGRKHPGRQVPTATKF
jgi:hypothetical protein